MSNRTLSPGGRRLVNPGRISDSVADAYRHERHNSRSSPRSSVGVIPISTQTFINVPSSRGSTTESRYESYSGRPSDSYSGRPRRSSLVDGARALVNGSSSKQSSQTSRPTVVQSDYVRSASPTKGSRDKEYYVTAASSKDPRKSEHKKMYSVSDGSVSLVADVNVPAGSSERHHRRRDSEDRATRSSGHDRDGRGYHLNGPDRSRDKSIDDDGAYSYTDAAGMYRETEPQWRDREARPRRGSVDRGGASRERPISMIDPGWDVRKSTRDGPPLSTRGWSKINDGLGRTRSVRDSGSSRDTGVPQSPPTSARMPPSPTRGIPQSPVPSQYLDVGGYSDSNDRYYARARADSTDRRGDPQAYSDRYESTRARGFGIRGDSQERYGRGSDESFDRNGTSRGHRDSVHTAGPPESHRRDTAPEYGYSSNDRRYDHERSQNEARERAMEREAREKEKEREYKERNEVRERERDRDSRAYSTRDYDQRPRDEQQQRSRDHEYEIDRERERERERRMAPREPDSSSYHSRREDNRDRDYARYEKGSRDSGEQHGAGANGSLGGLAAAGAAGLAGAAAVGASRMGSRNDERDRDRDRDRDRADLDAREARPDKSKDYDRDRSSPRQHDKHSDEGAGSYDRDRQRDSYRNPVDQDRGFGFAFEHAAEPPRIASNMVQSPEVVPRDPPLLLDQGIEADHEDAAHASQPPKNSAAAALDPDEDYRRRMEQAQRELGHVAITNEHDSDSDADRERRRHERRRADRGTYGSDEPAILSPVLPAPGMVYNKSAPPPPAPASHTGTNRSFESDHSHAHSSNSYDHNGSTTNRTSTTSVNNHPNSPSLNRKPSILDMPMMGEPAQIIDNSASDKRENRVRIVDPPTEEEERKPRSILKKPTQKFPEDPNAVREGVARLKDAKTEHGIPEGARWTKIDRKLVNPAALQEAKERYEERLDFVIVLRVITRDEIQKLADRTKEIRDERYDEQQVRRSARRRERDRDRIDRDEYLIEDSEDEFKPRAPKMLEAPPGS